MLGRAFKIQGHDFSSLGFGSRGNIVVAVLVEDFSQSFCSFHSALS